MGCMKLYATELKRRREEAGMTTRRLGDRIDRSSTFITDFELAKKSNPPEPLMMKRLAEVLDWPVIDQLQAWGYPVEGPPQTIANPFDRDDPRYAFVETIKRFDLSDEYDAYVLVAAAQVLKLIDEDRERFRPMVREAWHSGAGPDTPPNTSKVE